MFFQPSFAFQSPGCNNTDVFNVRQFCSYQVVLDTDLTSYFDVEGYLAEPVFKQDVLALLHKFEKQSPKPAVNEKKTL